MSKMKIGIYFCILVFTFVIYIVFSGSLIKFTLMMYQNDPNAILNVISMHQCSLAKNFYNEMSEKNKSEASNLLLEEINILIKKGYDQSSNWHRKNFKYGTVLTLALLKLELILGNYLPSRKEELNCIAEILLLNEKNSIVILANLNSFFFSNHKMSDATSESYKNSENLYQIFCKTLKSNCINLIESGLAYDANNKMDLNQGLFNKWTWQQIPQPPSQDELLFFHNDKLKQLESIGGIEVSISLLKIFFMTKTRFWKFEKLNTVDRNLQYQISNYFKNHLSELEDLKIKSFLSNTNADTDTLWQFIFLLKKNHSIEKLQKFDFAFLTQQKIDEMNNKIPSVRNKVFIHKGIEISQLFNTKINSEEFLEQFKSISPHYFGELRNIIKLDGSEYIIFEVFLSDLGLNFEQDGHESSIILGSYNMITNKTIIPLITSNEPWNFKIFPLKNQNYVIRVDKENKYYKLVDFYIFNVKKAVVKNVKNFKIGENISDGECESSEIISEIDFPENNTFELVVHSKFLSSCHKSCENRRAFYNFKEMQSGDFDLTYIGESCK